MDGARRREANEDANNRNDGVRPGIACGLPPE
jgi:hypothetical protein